MVDIPKFVPLVVSGETSKECNEVYPSFIYIN